MPKEKRGCCGIVCSLWPLLPWLLVVGFWLLVCSFVHFVFAVVVAVRNIIYIKLVRKVPFSVFRCFVTLISMITKNNMIYII